MNGYTKITKFGGKTYKETHCDLQPDEIRVDSYQREKKNAHVLKIVQNFDPHAVHQFIVCKRGKNHYIVDGQQELNAIKVLIELGQLPLDHTVSCKVIEATKDRAARIYEIVNNSKPLSKGEKFKSRLARRDKWALDVVTALENNELTWRERAGKCDKNEIPQEFLGYLEKHYKNDGGIELLDSVLSIIQAAWKGGDGYIPSAGRFAPLLKGLADALHQTPHVKRDVIVKRMKDRGVFACRREGKGDSNSHGGGQEVQYAEYFTDLFTRVDALAA